MLFFVYGLLAIFVLTMLYLWLICPNLSGRYQVPEDFKRIAHRGLFDQKKRPENSLAAFQYAVDQGFAIELDIQETKDGELVIFHDWDLMRMCHDSRKVCDVTYEELSKLSLLSSNQKIPTLDQALSVIDGKVGLLAEIKVDAPIGRLCNNIQRKLDLYTGKYVIESFDPRVLAWYKKNRSYVIRGQLASTFKNSKELKNPLLKWILKNLFGNVLARPDFIAFKRNDVKSLSLQVCKKIFACKTFAWTVRSKDEELADQSFFDAVIFDSYIPESNS